VTPSSKKLRDVAALVADDLASVERVLREAAVSVAPLITAAGEHGFAGGKRIRPLLVLLGARLCGYQGPRAVQIAAASELLHGASLVHDDVVDGAPMRHGRPSLHARFGARLAVLAGDFFFGQSSALLVEDGDLDVLAIYADVIRKMAEGEVLQLSRSFDPEVSETVYFEVIGRKTAMLLAAAAESGAILGGVTRSERRALREYGFELGLAFQLSDDALDYARSSDELGKPRHADLREGKVTLPLLVALKRCSVGEREETAAVLKSFALLAARDEGPPDPDDLARVAERVERFGGVEHTLQRARASVARARSRIEPFAPGRAKQALLDLADFVVERSA
jgi:octaprenyl-diphosphate synthase